MADALSPQVQQFLRGKVIAHLATVMKDGSPQVTPVWVDTDGTHILVNTAEARVKVKNLRRDPRVAISITDPATPQKMLVVRGRVTRITTDDAADHISQLAKRYTGANRYSVRPGEVRLKVFIEPVRVVARGI